MPDRTEPPPQFVDAPVSSLTTDAHWIVSPMRAIMVTHTLKRILQDGLRTLHGPPQSEMGLTPYRRRLHWRAATARVRGEPDEVCDLLARGERPLTVRVSVEGGPVLWEAPHV